MKIDIACTFEKIYAEESDTIFRFCAIRVSNKEQALDITQETFLRLWQTLSTGEKVKNPRAFLFLVARRLIIDWYRKKKSVSLENIMYKDGEVAYDPVDEKTMDILNIKAEGRFLLERINDLSDIFRDPVHLSFIEGLSPKEIGDILGLSANTVSVRVHRGIEELRKNTGYEKNKKTK